MNSKLDNLKEKKKTSFIEECIIWSVKTDADKEQAINELEFMISELKRLKDIVEKMKS